MTGDLAQLLANLPPRPARSRLEPYRPLIDELRRRQWSYRAIVAFLAEKAGVRTSVSNLHHFLQARTSKPPVQHPVESKPVAVQTKHDDVFAFDEAKPLTLK